MGLFFSYFSESPDDCPHSQGKSEKDVVVMEKGSWVDVVNHDKLNLNIIEGPVSEREKRRRRRLGFMMN